MPRRQYLRPGILAPYKSDQLLEIGFVKFFLQSASPTLFDLYFHRFFCLYAHKDSTTDGKIDQSTGNPIPDKLLLSPPQFDTPVNVPQEGSCRYEKTARHISTMYRAVLFIISYVYYSNMWRNLLNIRCLVVSVGCMLEEFFISSNCFFSAAFRFSGM